MTARTGPLQHLRWHYGDIQPHEMPVARATGIPFVLRRQSMPVPEFFDVSWQAADGQWRLAHVPVGSRLPASPQGRSVLFMIDGDQVTGDLVFYTPYGDKLEPFARATATVVSAAAASAIERSAP